MEIPLKVQPVGQPAIFLQQLQDEPYHSICRSDSLPFLLVVVVVVGVAHIRFLRKFSRKFNTWTPRLLTTEG